MMTPKRIILVDFENIQRLDFDNIDISATNIAIFVGKSQNKIPFPLVEKAQSLGDRLVWIKLPATARTISISIWHSNSDGSAKEWTRTSN